MISSKNLLHSSKSCRDKFARLINFWSMVIFYPSNAHELSRLRAGKATDILHQLGQQGMVDKTPR
jgi:hypothetical protein